MRAAAAVTRRRAAEGLSQGLLAVGIALVAGACVFEQVGANRFEVEAVEPDSLAHERFDSARLVDQLEDRVELRGRKRNFRKHQVAFEKVGNDPSARYAQQLEQHRRPHPSAVAAGRAVEEQGVNIALGEDFKKGAPVVAELVNDRVMLAAGDQAYRLALLEPAVADRDMLPPNRAQ